MLHFLLSSPSGGLTECKQSPPFCVLQASQALVAPSLNKAWKHPESIEIDGKLPGGRSRQDRLLFSSSGGWQVTTTGLQLASIMNHHSKVAPAALLSRLLDPSFLSKWFLYCSYYTTETDYISISFFHKVTDHCPQVLHRDYMH